MTTRACDTSVLANLFRIWPRRLGILTLLCLAGRPVAAGELCDDLRTSLLEQSPDRTLVRLEWGQTDQPPGPATFAVAIPSAESPRLAILDRTDFASVPWQQTSAPLPAVALQIDAPRRYRDQWLVTVTVDPWVRDGEMIRRLAAITLEIRHPLRAGARRTAFADESSQPRAAYAGICINESAAEIFRGIASSKAGGPDVSDTFELSENWLRIEVQDTGIHVLTFEDLSSVVGARAEMIIPGSLRLFSAKRPLQPLLPEDEEGSWKRDYQLQERSLLVEAPGPLLAASDRLLFFAAGPETWLDRHLGQWGPLEHFEHEYADRLAYWLAWDEQGAGASGFADPPRRMASVDGTPTGSAPVTRDWHRARLHAERNTVELYGVSRDNWVWESRIEVGTPRSFDFEILDIRTGSINTLYTEGIGRFRVGDPAPAQMTVSFNDGPVLEHYSWQFSEQRDPDLAPIELTTSGFALRGGQNDLVIANVSDPNSSGLAHQIVFDAFDVTYQSDLVARDGSLTWVVFDDEVSASASWEFAVQAQPSWSGPIYVFRTTEPDAPQLVEGFAIDGPTLRFESPMVAGRTQHFCVASEGALLRPVQIAARRPRLLRAEVRTEAGYDMVILHPESMAPAADALRVHRSRVLDGHPNPRVATVDLQDVYDQFGHGVKEPAALRNYLKFLYVTDPRLEFVALMGDASRDYRNRAGRDAQAPEIDRCPTYIQTHWPADASSAGSVPYAYDGWLTSFDDPPITRNVNVDLPDLAIGRLPASNLAEATQLVRRTIDYETSPAAGVWRNRALLVADDEFAAIRPNQLEKVHVEEAECITDFLLPPEFDIDKLYLTDFPKIPGAAGKPNARASMRQRWSDGALIVHYIGHGSPEQMADEAVFRIEDVPGLQNGERLPLFLAFSCDVAIFEDPVTKSMTEQLVLAPQGGAVAGIAATQVTFSTPNENLTEAFYPLLYPEGPDEGPSKPIGRALTAAKAIVPQLSSTFTRHNNAKYVILGDPALQLQSPWRSVVMDGDLSVSIRSGQTQTAQGTVEFEGQAQPGLTGRYYFEAKESADSTRYVVERQDLPLFVLPYVLPGSSFFSGTGAFDQGSAQLDVLTPAVLRFGQAGRTRLLLESGSDQYVGLSQPLPVLREAFDRDDEKGPSLALAFENDSRQVTPGTVLTARLEDESGINVLGSSPANSIQLEFDDNGFPIDVTPLFHLDDGTFTAGSLEYETPASLTPGAHRVVLRASDMLDNLASTELSFSVIAEGGLEIANHAVYPNPFSDSTRFVIEVTSDLHTRVDITIYTANGLAVRTLSGSGESGGAQIFSWDGRDNRGDEVANGVYLYVARARFTTDPPLKQQVTGRVVRMR